MTLVIKVALFLGKQELAFREHDESVSSNNRGNFKEQLKILLSVSSDEIKNHYNKIKAVFNGDSKTIQNKIIECISDYIFEQIKKELNDTDFFFQYKLTIQLISLTTVSVLLL